VDSAGAGPHRRRGVAEQWAAAQTGLKRSTLYRYRSILSAQLVPRCSQYRLADVTQAEISAWVAGLVASGPAPGY
jgi:hypothetical protein